MNKSGVYTHFFDPSCKPGDDLFRHVNGNWLDTYEMPEDKASYGTLAEVDDRNMERLRDILASCNEDAGREEGLIASLYASFMDEERIEALGVSVLEDDLQEVRVASDKTSLVRAMSGLQGAGLQAVWPGSPAVKGVLEIMGDLDANDTGRYIISLMPSGLGLPDKAYYEDEKFARVRELYLAHIANMLRLADLPDIPAKRAGEIARTILRIETAIAAGHWNLEKRRDLELTHNPMKWDEVKSLSPGFPWDAWAEGWGRAEALTGGVNVQQPDYLETLSDIWRKTPLAELKEWLCWRILSARSPLLGGELAEEHFSFNGRELTGAKKNKARWEQCTALCNTLLGDAVGRRYVARYFPPKAKERIIEMTSSLFEAYRAAIDSAEWMGPNTKARALEKLSLFKADIGYPTRWRDHAPLHLRSDDLLGNIRNAIRFERSIELAKVGAEIDRQSWMLPPQMTNAYFLASQNKVVFLAGILQPPIFDMEADDAVNYGAIGAVIAHEISHGFDDQGSKYDGRGRLETWWDDTDRAEFETRVRQLTEQFDAYAPTGLEQGFHVNGTATAGENIADLGGLSIAILAYRNSLNGKEAPVIDGMTGLQRLFYGWAQFWRFAIRSEEAKRRLTTDVHSPNEFRTNGVVRNIPEFYEAFGVTQDDALYLPPEKRVKIW